MKISLGTTSSYKVKFIQEVIELLDLQAELILNNVESGVSSQPRSSEETREGSINRAKGAYEKNTDADFALGIEVGYDKDENGKYSMLCWAAIFDGKEIYLSKSHEFPLPKYHNEIVAEDKDLRKYVEDFQKENKTGIYNYLRDMIDFRKIFITESVRDILIKYLLREEF